MGGASSSAETNLESPVEPTLIVNSPTVDRQVELVDLADPDAFARLIDALGDLLLSPPSRDASDSAA